MAVPIVNGQPVTPYFPIQVAAALRFIDANGDLVTQMFPTGDSVQTDSPTSGYISLIGANVGTLKTQLAQVNTILTQYAATLTSLQNQITAIQTSGATFIPNVNGGCLNGNTPTPVDTAVTLLIASYCPYVTVWGTPTALNQAILAEGSATLNTAPAFSQNSVMSGLTGWKSSPSTIADSLNNNWLTTLDSRAGITKALAAVTPTCSQVIVAFQAVHVSSTVFNIYFNGYTFIPTGYTDNGSTIQITDGQGGILLTTFNIVTQSTAGTPLSLSTSGSTLSSSAAIYTVQVNSNVQNISIGLTCQKTVLQTVTASGTGLSTFDIGNYTSGSTSASTYSIVQGLTYTPRFVALTPKNTFSAFVINSDQNSRTFLTYVQGGAFINTTSAPSPTGTFNIDWIAYR